MTDSSWREMEDVTKRIKRRKIAEKIARDPMQTVYDLMELQSYHVSLDDGKTCAACSRADGVENPFPCEQRRLIDKLLHQEQT